MKKSTSIKLRTVLLSLFASFLTASCSNALRPISYTDVNVSFDRSLIKIPDSTGPDAYSELEFFTCAEVTGGYSTKVKIPLSLNTLTESSEITVKIPHVPVNADINIKLTVEAGLARQYQPQTSDLPHTTPSSILYSGHKSLRTGPGINHVELFIESQNAPFFTDTTKNQHFSSSNATDAILFHAKAVVPYGYWENTLAPSELTWYLLNTSEENFDEQAAAEAFQIYRENKTNPSDAVYMFSEVPSECYSYNLNWPESADKIYTINMSITPETLGYSSTDFYTAWVVTYTDFNGKSGEVFSRTTKFTCAENADNFSFVINYTGQTHTDSDGNEYILSDEFDPEAFSVMETWGDIESEGDFKNYSNAIPDIYTYNKPVGEISINFSRLNKTCTWTKTFKYLLPDIEEAALVLDSSSLYVSSEAIYAGWYYLNNELTSGWTTQFIWIKDGTNLTENQSVASTQSYIDITQDEYKTGIYSVLVKLYAASDMYQWALYKDGSTPEYDAETKTVVPAVKNLGPVTITEESSSSGSSIITLGTYATNGPSQGDGSSPDAAVNIDEYLSSIKAGSTFYPKSYAVTMTGEAPAFDLNNISDYTSGGIVYYPDSDYLNSINIGLNKTALVSYLTIALTKLPSETMLLCKVKNKGSWSISQLSLSSSWTLDDNTTDADGYTLINAIPN